jgi:hypothetical protein
MKKQYQAPQLYVHGTMESLTQVTGGGSSSDTVQVSGFGFPTTTTTNPTGGSKSLVCTPTGCQ